MRPSQTLEGAVVDALRSPNRAARRQAYQGHLSLGSRDRHSLRRVQGDGQGYGIQRDGRSEGNDGSFVVIDVASGWLGGGDVVTWPDGLRNAGPLAAPG